MVVANLDQLPAPPAGKTGWPWTEQSERLPETLPDGSRWPRISVITTSYNYELFIEETIRSILLQGYPNLEYIIIDDESRDGSVQIIRKYERWLSHWEQQKNQGQAKATNRGFSLATGDVLAFINSDDLLEPDALACVGEKFARGAQRVSGAVRQFGPSTRERIRAPIVETSPVVWFGKNPIPQQGSFWSSQLSRQYGLLREDLRYLFDLELWLRFRFIAGVRPLLVDQTLARYRFHERSKSVSHGHAFRPEIKQVRTEYRHFLTPTQKAGAWLMDRKLTAGYYMNRSMSVATEGNRSRAISDMARSLLRWPPIALSRRTAGVLRRIVTGQAASNQSKMVRSMENLTHQHGP